MSKTSTNTASAAKTKQGEKFTSKTTLNADMLLKHKLPKPKDTIETAQRYVSFRNDKRVRDFSRAISTYRLLVHGVTTKHRLASPLRSMAHYFSIPLSRGESNERRETAPVADAVASE